MNIEFLPPSTLVPHEEIIYERLVELSRLFDRTGEIDHPILVDRRSHVILDGHHRWTWAVRYGVALVPCHTIDYLQSPRIQILSRRSEYVLSKELVIRAALSGNRFPPKTTRHVMIEN